MARQFNGTTQGLSAAINLSAFAQISISFWLWWDVFAQNDKLAFEFGGSNYLGNGFIVDPNATNAAHTKFNFGIGIPSGSASWVDEFTRPTAAAWHHYVLTMDRATPVNVAYVDGAAAAGFATTVHNSGTYGNFANSTLRFMCRNGASLFGAGRMAEVALWGGVLLTAREALALSSGISLAVGPVPTYYWPVWGADSPEPDYGGLRKAASLTATPTAVAHPPVGTFRPLSRYSYSG